MFNIYLHNFFLHVGLEKKKLPLPLHSPKKILTRYRVMLVGLVLFLTARLNYLGEGHFGNFSLPQVDRTLT